MKYVFFDLENGTLSSQDGRVRPFMDDVLEYCYNSKIRVYLSGSTEQVDVVMEALGEKSKFVVGSFRKNGEMPHYPDLVISANSDYLKKFPGLLIPAYDPEHSNKFADISLAGRLLDTIKDRVVLNRFAPEKAPQVKEQPEDENPGDPSNWAFGI